MLKKSIFLLLISFTPMYGYSFCMTNWYMRGLGGYNHLSIPKFDGNSMKAKSGYVAGVGLGYKFTPTFRMEGEFSYRCNDFDKLIFREEAANVEVKLNGKNSSLHFMANIIFDIPLCWPISPYFGGGVGGYREWGHASVAFLTETESDVSFRGHDTGAAYQWIVGINLIRCLNFNCGVEYHFLDALANEDSNHSHSLAISGWWMF